MSVNRTRPNLLVRAVLVAGALLASCGDARADGLSTAELLTRAQTSVFQIKVTRAEGPGADGSAVAIGLSPKEDGKPRVATFATAYHVMQRAKDFAITNFDKKPVAQSDARTRCFTVRTRDIVFLQVEVDEAAAGLIRPISIRNAAPGPANPGAPLVRTEGIAFGFSAERSLPIDYSQIELLGTALAGDLDLVSKGAFRANLRSAETYPGSTRLRLAGRDATFRGMSGGLVTDRGFRFAGLVFGRQLDRYNLIVPAELVQEAWDKTGEPGAWQGFAPAVFEVQSPFKDTLPGVNDDSFLDKEDWGTVDGLVVLMGEDPIDALQHFQEISITPPEFGADAKPVKVVVRGDTFKGGGSQSIELSLDGMNPQTLGVGDSYEIPLDKPGEGLLLVKKVSGNVHDFEVGRFLAPSIVDLSFQQGSSEFRRVVRSLPQVVQGYPLFITVRRSDSDSPQASKVRPANARIAIRLDFAQRILNQAPFVLELEEKSNNANNKLKGSYFQKLNDGWTLEYGTSQQLKVSAGGSLKVTEAQHADVGVGLANNLLNKDLPINFRGVVQFPSRFDSFYISSRITGAKGNFPLLVELSPVLKVNAGGMARHLFSAYLNNQILQAGVPRMTPNGAVGTFLKELGLATPEGWLPDPRQIALVQTPGGKTWLVATVRIDREKEGAAVGDPPAVHPELLEAPEDSSDSVFDISAYGIPGKTIAGFPGLSADNPLVAQGLSSTALKELHLSVTAPLPQDVQGKLEPLPTQIPVSLKDTSKLTRRIKDAFIRATLRGRSKVTLSLSADAAPAALAQAVRARPFPLNGELAASLDLAIEHNLDAFAAVAKLGGGPLTLKTTPGQLLPLSDAVRLRDATLVIGSLDVRGKGQDREVVGSCAAELRAAHIEAGPVRFENLAARVELAIDTRTKDEPIRGTIRLLSGDLFESQHGQLKVVPSPDFAFQFDRDLRIRYDPEELTRFIVRVALGIPHGAK